jgi:hypothetical protein
MQINGLHWLYFNTYQLISLRKTIIYFDQPVSILVNKNHA